MHNYNFELAAAGNISSHKDKNREQENKLFPDKTGLTFVSISISISRLSLAPFSRNTNNGTILFFLHITRRIHKKYYPLKPQHLENYIPHPDRRATHDFSRKRLFPFYAKQ